jgi:hypothetical protein
MEPVRNELAVMGLDKHAHIGQPGLILVAVPNERDFCCRGFSGVPGGLRSIANARNILWREAALWLCGGHAAFLRCYIVESGDLHYK